MASKNTFNAAKTLTVGGKNYTIYSLRALEAKGVTTLARLPYCIRVLLENIVRNEDGVSFKAADAEYVGKWDIDGSAQDINMTPARVLLQDFTGVPCVVDLAAMRDALAAMGADPTKANPLIPVDLVIDHSVQVDHFGAADSFDLNTILEYQRNRERYQFLKWGQMALQNFRVVPPETGIVHQVNLEYLAPVVFTRTEGEETVAYPDSLVGTDSHTTMINGIGVVGWGVGGIEAEACMLGQPITMLLPQVVGFKFHGRLKEGVTATDLVLTVTQMLRKKGVVGKFVEFYGDGVAALALADRATIANMAPEYGATIGFFPVDHQTLLYLHLSNRSEEQIALVEAYAKEQGLFLEQGAPDPVYNDTLSLDLSTVVPSLAGPKRPQDRIDLPGVKANFLASLDGEPKGDGPVKDGSVVIAAITSCTNTSNPAVLVAAGLLAKKAVEKGLSTKPWVKTSLAPGSKVVMDYLTDAKLLPYLEKLKFNLVGFGCTTCIGNSGPLPDEVAEVVAREKLTVAAVLSGNRNFEGRVNPQVRANYLASPPLVVAYALAGRVDTDLQNDSLGTGSDGNEVYLRDIWPTDAEIAETLKASVRRDQFARQYADVFKGDANWAGITAVHSDQYTWDNDSTYIKKPPYFDNPVNPETSIADFSKMRILAALGDSVTTDHISPAGNIAKDSPAGKYLLDMGVQVKDFNSYGARRGNHEVMVRGTLANIRLRNAMAPGTEGPWTVYVPSGTPMWIYDASMKYQAAGIPLMIVAGKEYGSGSSRDWAAKGVALLGVRAVIAESFERIHRSNLVGMGVLPLEFIDGATKDSLGLTGLEEIGVSGVKAAVFGNKIASVTAIGADGISKSFNVRVRIDTPMEVEYYRHGGILPFVLRQLAAR
jgi:aconitate hydratase